MGADGGGAMLVSDSVSTERTLSQHASVLRLPQESAVPWLTLEYHEQLLSNASSPPRPSAH